MADIVAAGQLDHAEISAVVTRADGTVEDYGTIAVYDRATEAAKGPFARMGDRLRARFAKRKDAVPVSVTPPDVLRDPTRGALTWRIAVSNSDALHPYAGPVGIGDSFQTIDDAHEGLAIADREFPSEDGYSVWIEALVPSEDRETAKWVRVNAGAATVWANAGKDIVTNRIKGAGTEPNFVAIGTGAGTAAIADTTLFTEVETRTSGTSTRQTTTTTNDSYQVVGTVVATAIRAITNAGLFDAATVGNMLLKGDFATINLAISDSIQLTAKLSFT